MTRRVELFAMTLLIGTTACGGGGGSSSPPPAPPAPPANSSPTVAAINDRSVGVGDTATVAVGVSDSNAGDTHTIAASAEAACLADLEVSGTTLTITGLVAGTTTVSVTATDSSGSANATSAAVTFDLTVEPPQVPDWALPRAAPAAVDIGPCPASRVLDHVFTDAAVQSAVLVGDGQVIAERYAAGYDIGSLGTSWSVAKSFYSAAIGIAIDRGDIESLDQPASVFIHEWAGTNKESITVRNLLEMRAGLPNPDVFTQANQTQFALAQGLNREPGTTFLYSNITSQLFEPLLRRATGLDAHEWLARTVLEPIGIDRDAIGMWFDPTGVQPLTYCCLDMRPDDFARFGWLFANGGLWDSEQVVSADYVEQSLAARVGYYGLQWWVMNTAYFSDSTPDIDVSAAHGFQGQHIYVWREGRVVLVVLTEYDHDVEQGYVLSLTNFPSTCAARNDCPDSTGEDVPSFDEWTLLNRLAGLR